MIVVIELEPTNMQPYEGQFVSKETLMQTESEKDGTVFVPYPLDVVKVLESQNMHISAMVVDTALANHPYFEEPYKKAKIFARLLFLFTGKL